MGGSYRTSQAKNRSRFYLLLSVILLVVLFKWGIPYFIEIVAGKGVSRQSTEQDIIPPQIPTLSALPEATNSALVLVEGYTEPGATVAVLVNDEIKVTDQAKDDGLFSLTVQLSATDTNRLQVRASDTAGNMSNSEVKSIKLDTKPVEITVISPKDGTEMFGKNNQVVEIRGEVNKKDSQLIINNSFVVVNEDGSFLHRVQLANGTNEFKVIASDKAGNSSESKFSVVYTP